jgi:phosphoserine aminotransferase
MTRRVHNFNGGPAALPLPVLEQIQESLIDFQNSGMSILEMSHRGGVYEKVHNEAIGDIRKLLGFSENDYSLLFMGGGARTQFGLVPMNLLPANRVAEYLVTGYWSQHALADAEKIGKAKSIWSSEATKFDHVPQNGEFNVSQDAAYLHYTSNNTIYGTEYHHIPDSRGVPLVCDMSSDILSRPIDVSRFGLIYGGAQKNMGPAGVTVLIIRKDVLESCRKDLPSNLSFQQIAKENSLLNTPPVFAIYIVGLVAKHLLRLGGLKEVEKLNTEKSKTLYDSIDASKGFYRGCAQKPSRSKMNVTFRLPSEEFETQFLSEASKNEMVGMKGHRSIGGVRVSLYNAVSLDSVKVLVKFMSDFQKRMG